jgi:hypothetical protein
MDLLTPTINVPAERAKLLRLRNEIAADVAHREAIQRKYSPRGFPLLPDVQPLATQSRHGNGETPACTLRSTPAMGIPAAASDMRETQAGCCGHCSGAGGVEREGVDL